MIRLDIEIICYERELSILVHSKDADAANELLEFAYGFWCEYGDSIGQCCEEFMLNLLAAAKIEYKECSN